MAQQGGFNQSSGELIVFEEPTKVGPSGTALTWQKCHFPPPHLFGSSSCHCNDTANAFDKLALADDGQVFHRSCLEKVPRTSAENRKESKLLFSNRNQEPCFLFQKL